MGKTKRKFDKLQMFFLIGNIIGIIAFILSLLPYVIYPNLVINLASNEYLGKNNETHIPFTIVNTGHARAYIANHNMRYGDVEGKYSYAFKNYILDGVPYIEPGEMAHFVLNLRDLSQIQTSEFLLKIQINYDGNRKVESYIKMTR